MMIKMVIIGSIARAAFAVKLILLTPANDDARQQFNQKFFYPLLPCLVLPRGGQRSGLRPD